MKDKILFIFLIILLMINPVFAHFVCGEVKNSIENFSSSWQNVRIYYPENRNNFGICKVSPAGNKYCCDSDSIKNKSWRVGDIIYSEVYDNSSGFISGPVSIKTTGEGFDVLPEMILKKVIKINTPNKKLYVNHNKSLKIPVNVSSISPYNTLYVNGYSCINCSYFERDIDFNFGMNEINVLSKDYDRQIRESFSFAILKSIDLNRRFNCLRCTNDKIKNKQNVEVNILLNLSHGIEDFEYREFVPVDFKILDSGGGEIKPFSLSHNVIVWRVNGEKINLSYKIRSPDIQIFARSYSFFSNLENYLFPEKKVMVYRFFNFFPVNIKVYYNDSIKTFFTKATNNNPIVIDLNLSLKRIAIFPKNETFDIEVGLIKDVYLRDINDALNYYFIDTDLNLEEIEKIYLEFYINNSEILDKGYNNISFYYLENNSWIEFKLNQTFTDDYYIYKGYITSTKGIAIEGKKQDIIDLLLKLIN